MTEAQAKELSGHLNDIVKKLKSIDTRLKDLETNVDGVKNAVGATDDYIEILRREHKERLDK